MIKGSTLKPTILENILGKYVLIGAVDHGMEIPFSSVPLLINSLKNVEALMMEAPEEVHKHLRPMSTEILTKASVGQAPISYLSGNSFNEDIGELVLKYAPREIAEIYVPCLSIKNGCEFGIEPTMDFVLEAVSRYSQRFGFIDVERTIGNYMKVVQYWNDQKLNPMDLDNFSYDFEKFVGDIREFECWQPELKEFRKAHERKIAVCAGDYHVPFVRDIFDDKEVKAPNWETHIDNRREDTSSPQSADYLKQIYANIEKALKV